MAVVKVVEITAHVVQEHGACNEPSPDFVVHLNFSIPFRSSDVTSALVEPNRSVIWHGLKEKKTFIQFQKFQIIVLTLTGIHIDRRSIFPNIGFDRLTFYPIHSNIRSEYKYFQQTNFLSIKIRKFMYKIQRWNADSPK